MNDIDRSNLLSAPFHNSTALVGQYTMRPLNLASYDVLLRTGNPLFTGGETPNENSAEFTGAVLGFIFAQCAPWPQVVKVSFDAQAFREASLIFCGEISPAEINLAINTLKQQARELEAAQVDILHDPSEKK